MKKINISGEIGWNCVSENIRNEIIQAGGEDIEFNIASPGGFVYEGIEIFNMIRDYKRQ